MAIFACLYIQYSYVMWQSSKEIQPSQLPPPWSYWTDTVFMCFSNQNIKKHSLSCSCKCCHMSTLDSQSGGKDASALPNKIHALSAPVSFVTSLWVGAIHSARKDARHRFILRFWMAPNSKAAHELRERGGKLRMALIIADNSMHPQHVRAEG